MKAYNITKLVAELKSDNVQYRKHCSNRNTVGLKDLTFLFIRQRQLRNDGHKDCYGNRVSWQTAVKTPIF